MADLDNDDSTGLPRQSSWVDLDRGNALQIMAISEDNCSISVDEENLSKVMAELAVTGVEAVSIISVVGAFRAGKSFLLDVFLRYLRNTDGDVDDEFAFPEDPNDLPGWLTCNGTQMRLTEGAGEPGFGWRSGRERTTTGIWMFSKPFVRTNQATGEKVAVLLMDTQGMFDMQTPPALTAAIFGLSQLISSYQIYNVSRQIQQDTLDQLHFFTEFSMAALREFEAGKGGGAEKDGRPFQKLEFLVRDWAHFDDNWSMQRCVEEMEYVLEDALVVNVRDAGTREQIKNMFDNITCFLLPHPGTDMTKPGYKGDLTIIEKSFLRLLSVYCHRVLNEGLTPKRIQGQQVTVSSLGHYIRAFASCFTNGQVPEALTLVQAMSSTTNLCAREKAQKVYKQAMEAVCGPKCDYAAEDSLGPVHDAAKERALESFEAAATFGKESDRSVARDHLLKDIEETRTQMIRENALKMDQSLTKYAPAVIIIVLAFVVDKLSDYTCDWWLESCVQMSSFLLLTYLALIGFIIYVTYELHQRRGSVAAVNGVLALGQASTRMSVDYGNVIKDWGKKQYDAHTQGGGATSTERPKTD